MKLRPTDRAVQGIVVRESPDHDEDSLMLKKLYWAQKLNRNGGGRSALNFRNDAGATIRPRLTPRPAYRYNLLVYV